MALSARLAELSARAKFGMTLGLDRVRSALAEMGDPHEHLAVAHVAGSNGKGSTSAMIEAIARASGLRTGLYTSPHLARFAERIRIDGREIEDDPFEDAIAKALRAAGGELTFFEALTVAAFEAFRAADVDLAVLEVGLGGRLDATNVIERPLACAITSISLEHTAVLGDTIDAIAREKAGILKRGSPYVLGRLPAEAALAIDEVAARVGAGPKWMTPIAPVDVALRGEHQRWNAAVASAMAEMLAEQFPELPKAIRRGLAEVRWPGRFEKVKLGDGVTIVFDGAHNDEGVQALVRAFEADGNAPEGTTLVFGALADKGFRPMLEALAPLAHRRIYTAPKGRAPAPFEDLVRIADGVIEPDPAQAIVRAIAEASPDDTVLVTGSLYLVGEIRSIVLGLPTDPIIPL